MISPTKLMRLGLTRLDRLDRDLALYGSLWVVAACLIVLAMLLLPGCSGSSGAYSVD
jgi:hypothetical protein